MAEPYRAQPEPARDNCKAGLETGIRVTKVGRRFPYEAPGEQSARLAIWDTQVLHILSSESSSVGGLSSRRKKLEAHP